MMIAQQIKEATATFHSLSEELNFARELTNGSIHENEYLLLLKRLHAFFHQLAILQENNNTTNALPPLFFEEKARLVMDDIHILENKYTGESPAFTTITYYEYLGFCYVATGSMLGGQVIYRNIIAMNSQAGNPLPCAFYASCKDTVIANWRNFIAHLQSIQEDEHDAIIKGATTAYLYFIYLSLSIH